MKTENKNICHKEMLPYLNKIKGQLHGISNMLEKQRYCIDIIQQLSAVRSAIRSVELKILNKHLSNCVTEAFTKSNAIAQQQKILEICQLIKKIG